MADLEKLVDAYGDAVRYLAEHEYSEHNTRADVKSWRDDVTQAEAAILAHVAALRERAENAEARLDRIRAAKRERLGADLCDVVSEVLGDE
jgi:hypothetical protein